MARKNPFANLMNDRAPDTGVALDYTIKGASRSIISTIDELAERADKLLEGETVVALDPGQIDASFVRDRLEEDAGEFEALVRAIAERGQQSPVLVRPHPKTAGRYMVVFGHRRVNAARALGRTVRAVIKAMDDRHHVIAQGQENSARSNLSFIEKAVFAKRLAVLEYDNDNATVMEALSIDKATLSKMLSVASLPEDVLDAIGAARTVGRDRWYELKRLVEKPGNLGRLREALQETDLSGLDADGRFAAVMEALSRTTPRPAQRTAKTTTWVSADKSVAADIRNDGKRCTLALKSRDAAAFGDYLASRLEALHAEFRKGGDRA